MTSVFVVISLMLHVIVPMWMWVYCGNRIDALNVRIEKLEDRPLISKQAKYSPRWRDTANTNRQRLGNSR